MNEMTWQTRVWHWAYQHAVDYEYGWHGKPKAPARARFWSAVNNALCWVFDRIGWGTT